MRNPPGAWTKPKPGSGAFFSHLAVTHFSGHLLRYHLDSLRPVQVPSIKLLPRYSRPLESPQSENPCPRLRSTRHFCGAWPRRIWAIVFYIAKETLTRFGDHRNVRSQ